VGVGARCGDGFHWSDAARLFWGLRVAWKGYLTLGLRACVEENGEYWSWFGIGPEFRAYLCSLYGLSWQKWFVHASFAGKWKKGWLKK
jgi:hypothetical protein